MTAGAIVADAVERGLNQPRSDAEVAVHGSLLGSRKLIGGARVAVIIPLPNEAATKYRPGTEGAPAAASRPKTRHKMLRSKKKVRKAKTTKRKAALCSLFTHAGRAPSTPR